ncbi:sulfatase-like hydrolase/transferase [candidate division KSB1 bacterium]|nr:sulfatase-like hydrolase/transferase [candidate division KSB1 bacterium]
MKNHQFSRREFMYISSAAAISSLLTNPIKLQGGKSAARPNIIIFMPDQLRADYIGCYGHPLVETPNIDRLAAEGTRFDHCQAAYPVCIASRCNMFTGWYPHVQGHRTVYNLLKPHEPNLFKYLKQNGYDVYWYGKNDVLVHDRFGESATEWNFFADGPEWSGKDNPWQKDDPRYFSFLFKEGKDKAEYPDYKRIQAAKRILNEHDSDKPFCIFLPLFFPHPPFTAPAEFYNKYDTEDIPPLRPANFEGKPGFYEAIHKSRNLDKLDQDFLHKINAVYLGMISYLDWLLGDLLSAVEKTNHDQDTAFIFCSDHGEWAGDYGLVEKWSAAMDDCILRVPLIIRLPGGAQGHVVNELVELHDVMATCLELADIEPQHTHFARSLIPQLHGKPGDPDRFVFAEGGYNTNEPHAFEPIEMFSPDHIYYPKIELEVKYPETISRTTMIRNRKYKLVLRSNNQNELYDMHEDPLELANVIHKPEYEQIKQRLKDEMLDWYMRTSDVVPFGRDDRSLPKFKK